MAPPANQREYEMTEHLIFLPLIIVILEIKIKIIRKRKVRKKRLGEGPVHVRTGLPLVAGSCGGRRPRH